MLLFEIVVKSAVVESTIAWMCVVVGSCVVSMSIAVAIECYRFIMKF